MGWKYQALNQRPWTLTLGPPYGALLHPLSHLLRLHRAASQDRKTREEGVGLKEGPVLRQGGLDQAGRGDAPRPAAECRGDLGVVAATEAG